MKKFLRISLITFLTTLAIISGVLFILFVTPPSTPLDVKKLKKNANEIVFIDCNGNTINSSKTEISSAKFEEIPKHVINAFVAIEDKNFFKHNGVDYKRIISAMLSNLKSFSYKQGASTISQQLIKNTHLTSKKTLSRKIDEIKLARKLEKQFSKEEIMEMYLNTIYFGENSYGIEQASATYFSKKVSDLTIGEGATLAGIINAPSKLNPLHHKEQAKQRRNVVLSRMRELGYIDEQIEITCKNEDIITNFENDYVRDNNFLRCVRNELDELIESRPFTFGDCKVYTSYDPNLQESLVKNKPEMQTDYQSIMLDNDSGAVIAYHSTCGEIERSPASTAKPLIVYAPAINERLINQYTKIFDGQTDFGNYAPTNYANKYYGDVSARFALSHSLNIPAVKVMNTLTTKKAKEYAKKMDLDIKSNGLGIALGSFDNGVKLKNIVAAYSTFANFGTFKKPYFINKIVDNNGNVLYKQKEKKQRVFSQSTSSIINDMLRETVLSGTEKRLNSLGFDIYAKSGTNGNANGNTDAYSIAYTKRHTFGVWMGNADNKLMSNEITGSSYPTAAVKEIIRDAYKSCKPEKLPQIDVTKLKIDKLDYDQRGLISLASSNAPDRYVFEGLFSNDNLPVINSTNFESVNIADYKLDFNDNTVNITYNLSPIQFVEIYKNDCLVYDGIESYSEKLDVSGEYSYSIVPYEKGKLKIYGKKIDLPKIKVNQPGDNKIVLEPQKWWEK